MQEWLYPAAIFSFIVAIVVFVKFVLPKILMTDDDEDVPDG